MSLLEQFDFLRNNDFTKRQEATLRIFSILDIGSKPVTAVTSLEGLKDAYGSDVQYTFNRLVKGLASNRESARLGFSAALSELLRSLPEIDSQFVLEVIEKTTTPGGNIKGQEIRDCQFGRLFGIQALCSSGILSRLSATMEDITPVLVLLFELAMSKGWLRESCANVIIQILDSLKTQNSQLVGECAKTIDEMLCTSQLNKTIEGVAIQLRCAEHTAITIDSTWQHGDLLHKDNLTALNKILRDQGSNEKHEEKDLQTGTWKPKLHFAWMTIIRAILHSPAKDTIDFNDFWRIVVDEGLFSANASHERKYWGFQLYNILVQQLPTQEIASLMTPNFLRTLSNQVSQSDRYLHKAARNSLVSMVEAAKTQRDKVPAILEALWDHNLFFDRLAKEKPCEKLIALTPNDSISQVFELLKRHCNPPKKSKDEVIIKDVEKRRQYVADSMLLLLRTSEESEVETRTQILDFFVVNGYYKTDKPKRLPFVFRPDLTETTRGIFRTRLQSALGHCMPKTIVPARELSILRVVNDFAKYREKKHFELVLQPDAAILDLLKSAELTIDELVKTNGRPQQSFAYQLLYSMTILDVYTGESDAGQVLEDLNESYDRTVKADARVLDHDEDDTAAMIDLLLGLLSRESASYRKLVNTVFIIFAPQMTTQAMQLLLRVFDADESGEALFDKANELEGDDDDEDEDEDDSMGGDEQNDDESMDDIEDEVVEAESGDDAERDAALDAALEAALGGKKRKASEMDVERPAGEGHESDFEADSDEEEELMDDDQMLAMDATLANIFKRQKKENTNTKKQDRVEMRTATNTFKRKTLDLVETFIKTCPSSEFILDIILPAMTSARKSSDAQYTEKVLSMLRQKLFKNKVLPQTSKSVEELTKSLKEIHSEAERSTTPPQAAAASQASLFMIKVLMQAHDTEVVMHEVLQVYAVTQLRWLQHKNSKLSTTFFVDFINWCTQWRINWHKVNVPATSEPERTISNEVVEEVETNEPVKQGKKKSKKAKQAA